MLPAEFLEFIEENFQEEEKKIITSCLLQDKRITDVLSQLEKGGEKDLTRLRKLENWSPVYLALLLENEDHWKYDLSEIRARFDQDVGLTQCFPEKEAFHLEKGISLVQAADCALGLFSLLRTRKWDEVEEEYFTNIQFNRNVGLVAACLLGYVDVEKFLRESILPSGSLEIKKIFSSALILWTSKKEIFFWYIVP